MGKIKRNITVTAAGLMLFSGIGVAYAGNLKYYDGNSYTNYIGELACSKSKVMHDVSDDVINSVRNETSCKFSARSWGLVPNTTIQVAWIDPGHVYSTFGDRNNQIDHFDRR